MKKSIFLFIVLILTAGLVFAQSNDGTVTQNGNDNDGDVTQTGNLNTAVADQINGDRNSADVDQNGASNEAYLTQGMTVGYYSSYGTTTTDMISDDNSATINQVGDANTVDFLQVGEANVGSISQAGNGNTSYAYTGWAGDWWGFGGVVASLYSDNSTVNISQTGNDHYAAVWQYGGNLNDVTITQTLNDNYSSIAQGFIYDDLNYDFTNPIYNVENNDASVAQYGVDNSLRLFQLGDDNSFDLIQNGDINTVGGRGLSGLEAKRNGYFTQDGNRNLFTGVQNDGATLDHASYQNGDDNIIDLTQGEDDLGLIQQDGDNNSALLLQTGTGHSGTIVQTGNMNDAVVTQQD